MFLDSNAKPKYIGNKIETYLGKLSGKLKKRSKKVEQTTKRHKDAVVKPPIVPTKIGAKARTLWKRRGNIKLR